MTAARRTDTGHVFEQMMPPAFSRGGYEFETQQKIGTRFGGGSHYVDWLVEKNGEKVIVSNKWQQVSGTAEQKVPFEVLCLQEAIQQGKAKRAYLVLGGPGWTLRDFYVKKLSSYMNIPDVSILELEKFIPKASSGKL